MVAVGLGVGLAVGPAVGVLEGVGVKARSVCWTMAASVGLGVKTDSSGGNKAYQTAARASEMRHPNRS
jgi:hypothetical protein